MSPQSSSTLLALDIKFEEFYQLRLGDLPPREACLAEGKFHLALIPIRRVAPLPDLSTIHRHFFSKLQGEGQQPDGSGNIYCQVVSDGARCTYVAKKRNSTQQRNQHLKRCHSSLLDELIAFRIRQGEDPLAFSRMVTRKPKPKVLKRLERPMINANRNELAAVLAKGIALGQQPFSIAQSQLVHALVNYFRPGCPVPSADMVQDALMGLYYKLVEDVKRIFRSELMMGSFTAVTWRRGANRKFFGLTLHYLHKDLSPKSVAIGFMPLETPHTADALREATTLILDEWGLTNKIICGTTDQGAGIRTAMLDLYDQTGCGWFPCCAHNMELSVSKALARTVNVKALLEKCEDLSFLFRNNSLAWRRLRTAQISLNHATKPLKPLNVCATRWNSKLLMAKRLLQLLPAIDSAVLDMKAPSASSDVSRALKGIEDMWIDQDEVRMLQDLLALVDEACKITTPASEDHGPIISTIYPTIRDLIDNIRASTTHQAIEEFKSQFLGELEKRWSSQHMPDAALIATFMNPACTNHVIFSDRVERGEEVITLREHAKNQITKVLHLMVKGGYSFNDATGTGAPTDSNNTQHWSRTFSNELRRYAREATVPCEMYRREPECWWKDRMHAFPCLSIIARIYFSVQASSTFSQRLFGAAETIFC